MRIELVNLEDGQGKFEHTYQPEELNLLDERLSLQGPVVVSGKVRSSGAEVFVTGNVKANLLLECDRCLRQLDLPVNTDFELEYITGPQYETGYAAELSEDELAVSVFDGEAIDIDEVVKEQVLLSVPVRALCTPECKGICSECGADLNLGDCGCQTKEIDPRWAALKNLKSDK
jgi:uncharacterized protein